MGSMTGPFPHDMCYWLNSGGMCPSKSKALPENKTIIGYKIFIEYIYSKMFCFFSFVCMVWICK